MFSNPFLSKYAESEAGKEELNLFFPQVLLLVKSLFEYFMPYNPGLSVFICLLHLFAISSFFIRGFKVFKKVVQKLKKILLDSKMCQQCLCQCQVFGCGDLDIAIAPLNQVDFFPCGFQHRSVIRKGRVIISPEGRFDLV